MKDSRIPADVDRWIVQMDLGTLADEDRRRLNIWLEESPANRLLFAEASALWFGSGQADLSESVRSDMPEQRYRPRQRPWRGLIWGAVATVAALIAIPQAPDWWSAVRYDYAVAGGAPVQLNTLADGSEVSAAPGSAFDFASDDQSRTLTLDDGSVWLSVAKDASRPFRVVTRYGTVEVTGTVFGVAHLEDRIVVSVDEGSVNVTPKNKTVKGLTAGDSLDPAGQLTEGQIRYGSLGWKEGQMRFNEASFEELVSALQPFARNRIVLLANAGNMDVDRTARMNGLTADASGFSGVVELGKVEQTIAWVANQRGLRITSAAGWMLIH